MLTINKSVTDANKLAILPTEQREEKISLPKGKNYFHN
jgi:hypothetical protein